LRVTVLGRACVRMCAEQMNGRAIGFQNRGYQRKISTPFDIRSEECRLCGGCMYICPACQLRCQGPQAESPICNACLTMDPSCLDFYDELQCWMYDAGRLRHLRPGEKSMISRIDSSLNSTNGKRR